MRHCKYLPAIAAALVGAVVISTAPAFAECKRMGFTVNDYGKDGPTKDAKDLLDKTIAKAMADRGVKTYTTGKKDVKCELFLNFIVFDEHTCTAEATVCWNGGTLPKGEQADAKAAPAAASAKQTTGSIEKPSDKPSDKKAEQKAEPKAEKPATQAATTPTPVKETAVPAAAAKETAPAAVPEAAKPTAKTDDAAGYPTPEPPKPGTP